MAAVAILDFCTNSNISAATGNGTFDQNEQK